MRNNTLTGFVIARKNLNDSDLIITFYTSELGKISVIAKGAKKPRAKLRSHVEPLVEVKFRVSGNSKLPVLVAAQNKTPNYFFSTSSNKQLAALLITETIGLVTTDEQPNQYLYQLYYSFLATFPKISKELLAMNYFLLSLLKASGLEPRIEPDSPKGTFYFDYDAGTVSQHYSKTLGASLSPAVAKLWNTMLTYDQSVVMRINTKKLVLIQSFNVICEYLEYHFAKKIKSLPVLRESTNLLQAD